MTFGYSLKLWEKSNALERESRQFNFMSDHYGLKYWIITYGDNSDKKYENYFKNAKIIPIYSIFKESKWKIVNIFKDYQSFKDFIDTIDIDSNTNVVLDSHNGKNIELTVNNTVNYSLVKNYPLNYNNNIYVDNILYIDNALN